MSGEADFTVKAEPDDFKKRDRLVKGSEPTGDICTEKMRRQVKLARPRRQVCNGAHA